MIHRILFFLKYGYVYNRLANIIPCFSLRKSQDLPPGFFLFGERPAERNCREVQVFAQSCQSSGLVAQELNKNLPRSRAVELQEENSFPGAQNQLSRVDNCLHASPDQDRFNVGR